MSGVGNAPLRPLDDRVIGDLVSNHAKFLSFLSKRLPSRAVAEDLLQQSLQKAFTGVASVDDQEKVTAWFYRILRNALIDYYRSRASEDRKLQGYLDELVGAGEDFAHAPDELRGEVCACMSRLLPTLHAPYAELIQKIDLDGNAPESVAKELGITPGNLSVRLHRAREALRKSLEMSCGSCTEHGCLDCSCE